MQAWNLKSNTWFAKYYYWMYYGLPNNICEYIKGLLWAIIFGILAIPGRLVERSQRSLLAYCFFGAFLWVAAFGVSTIGWLGLIKLFPNLKEINVWLGLLLGLLTVIVVLALIILIVVGIIWSVIKIKERVEEKIIYPLQDKYEHSKIASTMDAFKAFKEKHCAKINWIN